MKNSKLYRLSALFFSVFCFININAAPGDLDSTFNTSGFVKTSIGDDIDGINSTAVQSDGKILAVGYSFKGTDYDFSVVRYNSDGTLDVTFDGDGKVLTPVGAKNDFAYSVAIQPDGKIVVAGISNNGTNDDFAVIRYKANGSLDTTFDVDGKLTTAIGGGNDVANTVLIQSDGKIVVAGTAVVSNIDFAIARYNTDGSLDTTFDTDGKLTTAIGSGSDFGYGAAIQSDGKIVLAGYGVIGSTNDFIAARYNADGSLDTSFDGDGKASVAVGASNDFAYAVTIQTDGKIVIAGDFNNGANSDFAVVRLNTSGSLDTAFGSGGKATTAIGAGFDGANAVSIQADGKIFAAGVSHNGTNNDFAVVRFGSNGILDTSFDVDGKVTTPIGTSFSFAKSAAIQTDGKIIAAGNSNNPLNTDFALIRYTPTGSLDTTFNGSGKLITRELGTKGELKAIAIQTDGKIVAAGNSYSGVNYDFALVRYNSNGSVDTTFAGGKVTTLVGSSDDGANAVAVQVDGKIIAAGFSNTSGGSVLAVVRYNIDGSLDTSFDTDGIVTTSFGGTINQAYAVSIQTDGKIVAVGSGFNGSNEDFAVARFNSDGSLDTTFDTDGRVTTAVGTGHDEAFALQIQTDGKIVTAGYSFAANKDIAVVRYNANGSLDTTFDSDGKVTTAIGPAADDANSVAIQPDGKIIVGGSSNTGTKSNFAIVRYNSDGSLDTSFDTDGKVTTAIGTSTDYISSIGLESDGKIVAAGTTFVTSLSYDFALARYNANGSLDNTAFAENQQNLFGTGGIVKTDLGTSDGAAAVAIQSNGRIVVGGRSDGQFTVLRFLDSFAASAALTSISGRVTTASGQGIRNVVVQLFGGNLTEVRYERTGSFGYYGFDDLEVGQTYVLSVSAKRFTFSNPTRVINLNDELSNEDFFSDAN